MAFNVNELVLDKVRSISAHSINDNNYGEMLFRLTSLEDPSLQTTAEGEEIVDAFGATITTLYRAKKAEFSASNSLFSLGLAAAQFGSEKEIATSTAKMKVPTYEVITIPTGATEVELDKVAVDVIPYIYKLESNEIATAYKVSDGEDVSDTTFVYANGTSKKEGKEDKEVTIIKLPTGLTGKIYVDYVYETENANRVVNKTDKFPESCSLKIYAYFRDKCNDNTVYSGVIVSPKAKLNPEQVEIALTSTGKHAFTFQMMRDYCDDSAELFSIIVAE